MPSEAERARIIRKAVAAVQAANATWDRSQLIFELGQVVPALPAGTDPEEYLNGLADEAVSGRAEGVNVLQVAPVPDVIDVTRLGLRKDGTSIYRPPGEERFCTAEHRDHEQYLVDVAVLPVPQRVSAESAAAALAGTDLDYSQREACLGLLASGRLINCLVAPAGTGKTHVMAAFARVWAGQRAGRVIGLTASTNAARVMADEAARPARRCRLQHGPVPRQDQGLRRDPRARAGVSRRRPGGRRGHAGVHRGRAADRPDSPPQRRHGDRHVRPRAARRGRRRAASSRLIAARHGSYRLTEVRRFTTHGSGMPR